MLLRMSGRPASVSKENPLNNLGMQVALVLPLSMLFLMPLGRHNLNWFFPALMVLMGAHYLPFATLSGRRMFLFLSGILITTGVVIALYFSESFSLGAWIAAPALFVFVSIGRSIATGEVPGWRPASNAHCPTIDRTAVCRLLRWDWQHFRQAG